MTPTENPFDPADPLRHHLWERHIRADIDAFIAGDWDAVAVDFDEAAFQAIDAGFSPDPADWTIGFPTLAAYRDRWLEMSAETRATADPDRLRDAMFAGVRLARPLKDGQEDPYAWQSVFTLRLREGAWKITSFVGYMA